MNEISRKNITENGKDFFIKFYLNHFLILEERFYFHINDIISFANDSPFSLLINQNLRKVGAVGRYIFQVKGNFSHFGCAFFAKDTGKGQMVILKHIVNSSEKNEINFLLENVKTLSEIQSDNLEKIINYIIIKNGIYDSLWYAFEFNESVNLESVMFGLHKQILGYKVKSESEFVHLLYSCNSILDKSKESAPDFINVLKYIAVQLLTGISHLHEKGIIHKDLNPASIRMTLAGVLKITDFGVAKRYRWLQYDSRSFTENGRVQNNAFYQDSLKRLRLNGSYYYMEPHLRASRYKGYDCEYKPYEINSFEYHLDYFSCAMILFELTFGFTYGDMSLYKKYSFYEPFINYELIFFFPDYYRTIFDKFSKQSLVLEEFSSLQLTNLRQFLMNHEEGFVEFLIEGLSIDKGRWSQFITKTMKERKFDFCKLRKKVPLFQDFNYDNVYSNLPTDLRILLQSANFTGDLAEDFTKEETFLMKGDANSILDSKSFCIPEFQLPDYSQNKSNCTSSSKIDQSFAKPFPEKIKEAYDLFSQENGVNESNNKIITNIKKSKIDIPHLITNENNPYPSVFLHKLFDHLERGNPGNRSFDHNLKGLNLSNCSVANARRNQNVNNENQKRMKRSVLKEKHCPKHSNRQHFSKKIFVKNLKEKSSSTLKRVHVKNHEHKELSDYSTKGLNYEIQQSKLYSFEKSVDKNQYINNRSKPENNYHNLFPIPLQKYNQGDLSEECLNAKETCEKITPEQKITLKGATVYGSSSSATTVDNDESAYFSNQKGLELFSNPFQKDIPLETFQKISNNLRIPSPIKNVEISHFKNVHTKCKRINQSNNFNDHTRRQFLDSTVLDFLKPNRRSELIKGNFFSKQQTTDVNDYYFGKTQFNAFSSLFDIPTKKLRKPVYYGLSCVTSLASKEVQTQNDLLLDPIAHKEFDELRSQILERKTEKETCETKENETMSTFQLNFNVENELLENDFNEDIRILEEEKCFHLEVIIEPDFGFFSKENLNLLTKDLFCCNQKSFIEIKVDDVEEVLENPERVFEDFCCKTHKNTIIINAVIPKRNLTKKSVTFKFPLITDVFDLDSFKSIENKNSDRNIKRNSKEYSDLVNPSGFLRPKVNCENLEIIDDLTNYDEAVLYEVFQKGFDLKTIENNCFSVPSSEKPEDTEDILSESGVNG